MNNRTKAIVGAVAWLALVVAARVSPWAPGWTHVLIAFAALVLVPLALDLVTERRDTGKIGRNFFLAQKIQLPSAALLALSLGLPHGLWAVVAALPWALVTAMLASAGVGRLLRDRWARPIDRLGADVGLGFFVVSGMWVLIDRSGYRPLGFSPDIVALTAAHFHFAGLLLPLFAGQVARDMPDSRFASRAIVGTILGIPALAAGITFTQLGWTAAFETAAGCGLALAGASVGVLHVRWAVDAKKASSSARSLVAVTGVALFFAMALAALYALRPYVALAPDLGIPQMRAFHGTLNAFGVGLCGVLGWRLARQG